MLLKIQTDKVELTQKLQKLITEKIEQGIQPYVGKKDEDTFTATLYLRKRSRWGYSASFDVWVTNKEHIYAEEVGDDFLKILTGLRDKLIIQFKKYRYK